MTEQRRVLGMWYRSLLGDGSVWCEASVWHEVAERSEGRHCTFERYVEYVVSDGWQPWKPGAER